MSKWIEYNLPWETTQKFVSYKSKINLYSEIMEKFGDNEHSYKMRNFQTDDITNSTEYKICQNLYGNDFHNNLISNINFYTNIDENLQKLIDYIKFSNKLQDFIHNDPAFIEENEICENLKYINRLYYKTNCFIGAGLNVPGTLLEIEEDGAIKQILIGDVNTDNVDAGCCGNSAFKDTAIVKRYKILYSKDNL